MRQRFKEERITQQALAIEFGVTRAMVGAVVRGVRWADREERYGEVLKEVLEGRRKISDDDMVDIRARFERGEPKVSIARTYGVSRSTILYRLRQVGAI